MIYSDKYKYVYLSIPKTGSSAISSVLIDQFNGKYNKDRHDNEIPDKMKEYFVFTTIRNPYERAISGYSHLLSKLNNINIDNCWDHFHMISMTDYLNNIFIIDNFVLAKNKINDYNKFCKEIRIDKYIRFENLLNDFNSLYFIDKRLDNIPVINKSKNKYFLNTLCKLVLEKYKRDFIKFNYNEDYSSYRQSPIFY